MPSQSFLDNCNANRARSGMQPLPVYTPRGHKFEAEHGPFVEMQREAALALAVAIQDAQRSYVRELARIQRSRSMTPALKAHDSAFLRANLDTLTAFQAAHCEAHGLGGY